MARPTRSQAEREALGRRIRKVRTERRDRSLDWLADRVGTSRQHLINLEKGHHWPGDELLARIADALGTPVSYFLGRDVPDAHRERLTAALDSLAEALLAIARDTPNADTADTEPTTKAAA